MTRWAVQVSGDELTSEARRALDAAGIEPLREEADREFRVALEAEDSASARHRVEQALADVGSYSAGAATSLD